MGGWVGGGCGGLSDFSVKLWPRPSWELLTQYDNSSVLVQIWIGTKKHAENYLMLSIKWQ